MSVGHPHRRPNARHARELTALRREPDVARRLARGFDVDTAHDVADLAGYDTTGGVIYVDRHLVAGLQAGRIRLAGKSPRQVAALVMRALTIHEHTEKALIDAKKFSYPAAHEFATLAEHQLLRAAGVAPFAYEQALKLFIKRVSAEPVVSPPKDLDCTPYLDDPDDNDRRVLAIYRTLGVRDAMRPTDHHVCQQGRAR
jgi:hypothetical protein